MTSTFTKIMLFLSSYFPLSLIFGFLFIKEQPVIAGIILVIGLSSVLIVIFYLRLLRNMQPVEIRLQKVSRRDNEAMSYIVSYVIPFVVVPFEGIEKGIALGFFFLVLAVVYVNSNMIYINPTLTLMKFHIYEVNDADDNIYSLIARKRIKRNEVVKVVQVGEDILLEKSI